MERRDYLMRYIEELGRVLATLFDYRRRKDYSRCTEVLTEAYAEMLNLDAETICNVPGNELINKLTNEYNLSPEQLKVAAELLYEEGGILMETGNNEKAILRLERSKLIFEHIAAAEKTFSLQQSEKVDQISQLLKKLSVK